MKKDLTMVVMLLFLTSGMKLSSQIMFRDNFEGDLKKWELNAPEDIKTADSGDKDRGKVLVLTPNGNVSALIKDSHLWGALSVEGYMLFPENIHNYLGFIYNYNKSRTREDFGVIYVKGNSSYIRVNPWRDGNVSRLLYEEYKTNLKGDDAIKIGTWHKFKLEVINEICHLYINDMNIPKVTFDLFEFNSGKIGFQPRVRGGDVWIDDIIVKSIKKFSYTGPGIPDHNYKPDALITQWDFIGPLRKPDLEIEKSRKHVIGSKSKSNWKPFETDKRGAVITGKVTEYTGERTVAYFRTVIDADRPKTITLHFTTTDELTVFLNGKYTSRVYRDGYVSGDNDWNAWYDFWENPEHAGRKIKLNLKKGPNQIVIRVRNGQFASGGFFAKLER